MLCFCGCSKDTLKIYCWKFYQNWFILSRDIRSWTWPINSRIEKDGRNFRKGWLGQFHFLKHFFSSWEPNLTTNGWKAMKKKFLSKIPCILMVNSLYRYLPTSYNNLLTNIFHLYCLGLHTYILCLHT